MRRRFALLLLLPLAGCCAAPGNLSGDALNEVVRLERELEQEGASYDLRWKLAEACLALVDDPRGSGGQRLDYSVRALAHADAAIQIESERVEGHYYRAVSLGRVLENSTLPDLSQIGELEAAGIRAREIDPAFDCAGPPLLLALLYQKAPAWPLGPEPAGEEDVIEELFLEAVALAPECPENLLAYAEFLEEIDREEEALKFARKAKQALRAREDLEPAEREDLEQRLERLWTELDAPPEFGMRGR